MIDDRIPSKGASKHRSKNSLLIGCHENSIFENISEEDERASEAPGLSNFKSGVHSASSTNIKKQNSSCIVGRHGNIENRNPIFDVFQENSV